MRWQPIIELSITTITNLVKNHSIETTGIIFSSHFFQAAADKKNPDSDNVGF